MNGLFVDSYRYTDKVTALNVIKVFFKFPGFRFICLKRFCDRFSRFGVIGIISRMWLKRLQRKYGLQIPHKTEIGKGLFMGHYGGIVVNQKSVIGSNCNIAQGVTIGYISRGKKKGSPIIGDRVWIGANAVVVGNITIGNDVLIAPLTFVNFDVPDSSVVLGNPAKLVGSTGSREYVKKLVPL